MIIDGDRLKVLNAPIARLKIGIPGSGVYAGTGGSITGGSITVDTNGIAISLPAYLTTAMASTATFVGSGFTTASTAGTDIVGTLASNGLSMGVPAYLTTVPAGTGISNIKISAGTLSSNRSDVTFSDSNGISFGLETNGVITATVATNYQSSGAYLTTAALSQDSSKYAGTTAGMTGGSLTINTLGVAISLPAYLTTAMASNAPVVQSLNGSTGTISIIGSELASISNNLSSVIVSVRSLSLNEVQNPVASREFNCGTRNVGFRFNGVGTNPTFDGAFQIEMQGNFSGDLMHLHQHAGNATGDMLHIEGDDPNVTCLRIKAPASIAAEINQPILFTTNDTAYTIGSVPMILPSSMSNVVSNLNANYLQGAVSSQFPGIGTSATNASITLNSNGLAISVNPPTGGGAGTGFTSATTAGVNIVGTLSTNGLSVGVPEYLTTYVNDLTSGRAGVGETVGTTAGTDLALTVDTNGVSIAYPKWITTYVNDLTSGRAGTSTGATNILVTLDTNGIAISYDNANDAGTGFSSGSTAGTDIKATVATNGISMAVPKYLTTAEVAPATASYWENMGYVQGTSSFTVQSNSLNVQPFILPYPLSASYLRVPVSFANLTSTTVALTSGSRSFYYYQSINAVVYSQGGGANSRSLQYVTSGQAAFTEAFLFSVSNAGTNESIAYQITFPREGNNTDASGSTMLTTAAGASIYLHTTGLMTAFTGIHWLDIPLPTYLGPGNYWVAFNRSTASTTSGAGIAITNNVNRAHSFIAVTQINSNFVPLGFASSGAATASTQPVWQIGLGSHSVSAQGATTSSLALSSISSVANFPIIPMQFIRQA